MDEDTKLVLEAWRVLLVENQALRERIHLLEKEHVRERIYVDDSFTDWRRVGRGRRRNPDSSD
jgi:hypothetical protein